ncbi:MAG: flavodoxin-dependent (E)-4-hydroxy-3-methylbut-2-enyl-diphosphate synthase [Lentisphaeria bacterium]|nr:flavodoxin-dependent (E)-4-hydroxy-3-methylbut-2-enyl-diphosphate synthase [Lentisphaeria bacterium]
MSKVIKLGNLSIGGNNPVTIQSMLNTDTCDIDKSLAQLHELYDEGCEIIRLAVPNMEAAVALEEIVKNSPIPVIADIHFDYRLAVQSIASKVAGIRLNPGNLSNRDEVKLIADLANKNNIAIRVGANSGSVKLELIERLKKELPTFEDAMAEALVISVLEQCRLLEEFDFTNIKVSLKSSSVPVTVKACKRFAEISDYPLHIGITEAGTLKKGIIKSAAGIGALLLQGIGDTLRVSLSSNPIEEVKVAKIILQSCNLRSDGVELVSCPTCGRTQIDLIRLASEVEDFIDDLQKNHRKINLRKVAVMGCIVNGPGEAREADLGIAGGKGKIAIFEKGEVIGSFSESEGLEKFKQMILNKTEKGN